MWDYAIHMHTYYYCLPSGRIAGWDSQHPIEKLSAMNSKFLHFLFVLACAALIGLGPLRAQNPAGSSDANGSTVTAPARYSDASHSAVSPSSTPDANDADRAAADSQRAANTDVANDRGTIAANQASSSHFHVGWFGLLGLLGLLGLIRRSNAQQIRRGENDNRRDDYPRAA
jgi:MYXO-CTERM domain-containing protein